MMTKELAFVFLFFLSILFDAKAHLQFTYNALDSIPNSTNTEAFRIKDESCDDVVSRLGMPVWVMGGLDGKDQLYDWRNQSNQII